MISGQHKAEPPARLRSAYMLSIISCSLWNNGSKRARALYSISTLPESKEITLGSIQYIAKHDELLQPIVFNFIEYLTSTLCINLHLGYYCTRLPPSSSLPCAPPLYLDSDYFSVSVLDSQSSDLPHSLPKNQRRAFSTRDSVSNQGPSHNVNLSSNDGVTLCYCEAGLLCQRSAKLTHLFCQVQYQSPGRWCQIEYITTSCHS
jgi:hypothetical protein